MLILTLRLGLHDHNRVGKIDVLVYVDVIRFLSLRLVVQLIYLSIDGSLSVF